MKPAYEKAAKNLAGIAKVAAVNCDEESNKAFCGQFGVQGFPTLKIIKPGKKPGKPIVEDYQGPREAKPIVEAVSDKITNHVKRLKADAVEQWVTQGANAKAILFTQKGTTAPLIKALAIDFLGSIDIAQVRDKETAAVNKYDITNFPTVILIQGEAVSRFDGDINKEALVKFLSQAASPNLDPAPQKSKAKAKPTAPRKTKSASSKFSEASAKQESSQFEEYLEHASTVILSDPAPTESPLPIVEQGQEQKPMIVADVVPQLPMLESSADLRSKCLQPSSGHCVLVLLPTKENGEAVYSGPAADALSNLAAAQEKFKKRKAQIFPSYAIPATNEDASSIRGALSLKPDTEVEIIVINYKKKWSRTFAPTTFDTNNFESFMDDIRFGEGSKQQLPVDFLQLSEEQKQEEPKDTGASHDEL